MSNEQIEKMTPLDFLANDIYQHCPDLKDNYCGDTHCVDCLANALYNADYRKQEWISVDERLPDKYTDVLVYPAHKESVEVDSLMSDDKFLLHDGITHWMPLPEPPKMKVGAE